MGRFLDALKQASQGLQALVPESRSDVTFVSKKQTQEQIRFDNERAYRDSEKLKEVLGLNGAIVAAREENVKAAEAAKEITFSELRDQRSDLSDVLNLLSGMDAEDLSQQQRDWYATRIKNMAAGQAMADVEAFQGELSTWKTALEKWKKSTDKNKGDAPESPYDKYGLNGPKPAGDGSTPGGEPSTVAGAAKSVYDKFFNGVFPDSSAESAYVKSQLGTMGEEEAGILCKALSDKRLTPHQILVSLVAREHFGDNFTEDDLAFVSHCLDQFKTAGGGADGKGGPWGSIDFDRVGQAVDKYCQEKELLGKKEEAVRNSRFGSSFHDLVDEKVKAGLGTEAEWSVVSDELDKLVMQGAIPPELSAGLRQKLVMDTEGGPQEAIDNLERLILNDDFKNSALLIMQAGQAGDTKVYDEKLASLRKGLGIPSDDEIGDPQLAQKAYEEQRGKLDKLQDIVVNKYKPGKVGTLVRFADEMGITPTATELENGNLLARTLKPLGKGTEAVEAATKAANASTAAWNTADKLINGDPEKTAALFNSIKGLWESMKSSSKSESTTPPKQEAKPRESKFGEAMKEGIKSLQQNLSESLNLNKNKNNSSNPNNPNSGTTIEEIRKKRRDGWLKELGIR